MTEQTVNLALPYILSSQAQKHVTHNEALRKLDAEVQLAIKSTASSPPASPDEGDCHAVGTTPTGAWSGKAGKIALYEDGAWFFVAPRQGWIAWFIGANRLKVWDGSAWDDLIATSAIDRLGINSTADSTNRLSLSAPASLFNHDGAGHQIKLNKALATDTASILLQQGFSGRAELGLAGSNQFELKVSPNGADWSTALKTTGSGAVLLPSRPLVRASLGDTTATPGDGTRTGFSMLHHEQGGFSLGTTVPSGTGGRLIVPVSGYYMITLNLSSTATAPYSVSVQRNGTDDVLTIRDSDATSASYSQSSTTLVWLDESDWISLMHTGTAEFEFGYGKTELVLALM